jgi:hypothetical protein
VYDLRHAIVVAIIIHDRRAVAAQRPREAATTAR